MFDQLEANYLLGDVIGRGGMGVVHSATQRSLQRRVAVKIPHAELARDPFVAKRFRIEALAGAKLAHQNIARVIDFGGGDDGAPYIVMEHITGTALDTSLQGAGAFDRHTAMDLSCQILAALHASHTAGIIHADIKTANVLVETLPDDVLHARVIDFGLAHFTDQPTQFDARVLSGTPDYLAPELIRGNPPTVASDIYAAGVVLYELLTGTTPFAGGTSSDIMARHIDDAVVPPTLRCPDQQIPPAIEAAVMRALAKEPAARFATAAEFVDALSPTTTRDAATPRLARGTHAVGVFSAEATTRSWLREHIEDAQHARRVAECRRAVNAAIATDSGDTIVTAHLELARALIDGRDLGSAAKELEAGLTVLRSSKLANQAPVWRLQLCVAALYSGLGDAPRARQAATLGAEDAGRAESNLGQERAGVLLARLSRMKG